MNKPQAEGKVNSRLYSRMHKKKVQHTSAHIKKTKEAQMFISSNFLLIRMVELDNRRSVAKTLVNKMGFNT